MSQELFKKLQYKTGKAAVLHAPEGFSLGVDTDDKPEGKYAFVLLFVGSAAEVKERVPAVLPHLEEDAVFWLSYPKASGSVKPDINRDKLWPLVTGIAPQYRPVSNVAIDDRWSALRFRHQDKVKK